MTEDEAKTKACFKAATFGASQQLADGPGPHCIGSACMAWRALTRTEVRHRDGHVVQPGEIYVRGNATAHQVPDGGYCGAGASQ